MSFKMGGVTWYIIFVGEYDRILMRSDGTFTVGVTDWNTKSIYLSNRLSGRFLEKVLCHELCHVASFTYGLKIDIETEEIIANFMSLYGREILNIADRLLKEISEYY